MGNRLKRRKAKQPKGGLENDAVRGAAMEVTTWAGTFRGRRRGRTGWMVLESYTLRPQVAPAQALHSCGCPETGETYVKPYDGRYRHLREAEQSAQREALEAVIRDLGGMTGPSLRGEPLWLQLEFLENVIDFELNPPCGCPGPAASA